MLEESKLTITVKVPQKGWLVDDKELLLNVNQWLEYQRIIAEEERPNPGTGVAWGGFWIAAAIFVPLLMLVTAIIEGVI